MTVSYLDTIAAITEAEGLRYAEITKAMRVHVRSLVADGYVAAFAGDDQTTLDDPEGIVWLTALGADYVDTLRSVGLIAEPREQEPTPAESAKPKARRTRRSSRRRTTTTKPEASEATVPSPTESVKVTVVPPSPKGPQPTEAAVEVPALGATVSTETVTVGQRMSALEADMGQIKSALEILVGSIA